MYREFSAAQSGGIPSMDKLVAQYLGDVGKATEKYNRLKDLDLFVLDNSIRESTVGQVRGHTLESKWKLYDEVKKCGFKNTIVASYAQSTRVDDIFAKQVVEKYKEDREGLWGFSEVTDSIVKGKPDFENIPVGLRKIKEAGLWNVVFEIDMGDSTYDFTKFTMDDMCALMKKLITYCHDELHETAKVLVNLRDLPDVMPEHADRCFKMVEFLSTLPKRILPFGIIFEEPRGASAPEEAGVWARYIRKVMDAHNFKGHLLVHVHEKWGYCESTALQVLMDGANGVWASVCREGAAMGNAATCVTIMNLVRMGNKKVLKNFNCEYLRQAAIAVTEISTGYPPHKNQPVYGARALDMVFDMKPEEFDLSAFFGEEPPVRMSTMASPTMIQEKLVRFFGEDPAFTVEIGAAMKETIYEDLRNNRKEEYMSKAGLAVLFDRSGGSLTPAMRDEIATMKTHTPHAESLLKQIREIWDEWDKKDKVKGDDMLEYDQFYNAFMSPYFSCYRCMDTKKAMQALDMDADNHVDWNEFLVYLKWAIRQYPLIKDTDELLDAAFRKGLIPAMRDELIKKEKEKAATKGKK